MIKTAQDVLTVAEARGFQVKVKHGPPPMPYLIGDKAQATPALMEALSAFRTDVIEVVLKKEQDTLPKKQREYLWRFGEKAMRDGDVEPPVGAWWWRHEGETEWQVVPGREQWAQGHEIPA